MDIIELSREIGREIQKDKRYLDLKTAKKNSDEDKVLQDMIGEFNLKRIQITNEAQKEEKSEAKIEELNKELRECYSNIMQNDNMIFYNAAKEEIDKLLKRITAIIYQSADGQDPETTDLNESNCSGSCSSCSGCH